MARERKLSGPARRAIKRLEGALSAAEFSAYLNVKHLLRRFWAFQ